MLNTGVLLKEDILKQHYQWHCASTVLVVKKPLDQNSFRANLCPTHKLTVHKFKPATKYDKPEK